MNNLSFEEYINILSKVRKNVDLDSDFIVKIDPETKKETNQSLMVIEEAGESLANETVISKKNNNAQS